jgi:SRSO17 transposase
VVIIDAGYGVDAKFRNEINALKLKYVADVKTTTTVWAPEMTRPDGRESTPIGVEKLALTLPKSSWRTIRWRDGTNEVLSSRFTRVRVWVAGHRDAKENIREEWLLIEWPSDEKAPTKFWLSTFGGKRNVRASRSRSKASLAH